MAGIIASACERLIKQNQLSAKDGADILRCIIPSMREQQSTQTLFDKVIQKAGAARVRQIQIAIGEISELDQNAIEQYWNELSKGTPLEHAQIRFRLIPAEAQCMACFKKYHPVNGVIHCPHCGSFGAKILSGEEFHVEHIETNIE